MSRFEQLVLRALAMILKTVRGGPMHTGESIALEDELTEAGGL